MHISLKYFLALLFLNPLLMNTSWAQEWRKNNEKKAASRWTLQEWLNQKDRNRLMDQWLMLHTPTPYEFFLELESVDYEASSNENANRHKSLIGSFTAYATVVGLEFKHHNNTSEHFTDNLSLFHIRILGSADQSSHLTLSLGQKARRHHNLTIPLRTQYLGQVDLTLYMNKHFGFSYIHQSYYPLIAHADWGDLNTSQQAIRLFIDFEALRIFGGVFSEKETQTLAQITSQKKMQGASLGLRLYF